MGETSVIRRSWNILHVGYYSFTIVNEGLVHSYKIQKSHLKQLVTIGGPQDGVIEPWQSSQFMNFR